MTSYKIKGDVSKIECDAENCSVTIAHTDEPCARAEYTRGTSINFDKGAGRLAIRQKRPLLSRIFGGESRVKIYIPGHIVPALCFTGGRVDCAMDGGIYGEVTFAAEGAICADNAAMESCAINSARCDCRLTDCTVKGSLIVSAGEGGLTLENTFATHISARIKRGNVGAARLNCRDTIFETDEGNVTAEIAGDEGDFDVIVDAKEGTCNRESANIEGNTASFKAYSAKGNIFVDFVSGEEN